MSELGDLLELLHGARGTAIQLQSQELDVETLLDLAASLRPVG